jgi:hypothetical protein
VIPTKHSVALAALAASGPAAAQFKSADDAIQYGLGGRAVMGHDVGKPASPATAASARSTDPTAPCTPACA